MAQLHLTNFDGLSFELGSGVGEIIIRTKHTVFVWDCRNNHLFLNVGTSGADVGPSQDRLEMLARLNTVFRIFLATPQEPTQLTDPHTWFWLSVGASANTCLESLPTYCIDGNNLKGKLAAIRYVQEKYSLRLVDAKHMVDEIPKHPYGGLAPTGPDAYVQCGEMRFYRIDNTLLKSKVRAAIYMRKKLDCPLADAVRAVDAIPKACALPPLQKTPDTQPAQPVITTGSDMLLPNTRR